MKVIEKIENEKNKKNNSTIIFYQESGGFWGAYNQSAMLAVNFNNGLSKDKRLNVQKKTLNDGTVYVSVGLKLGSFKKYFPKVNINEDITDKTFSFDVSKFMDCDSILSNYESWFNEIEVRIKKNDRNNTINLLENNKIQEERPGLFTICGEILKHDCSCYDDCENINFLKVIQKQLITLF